MRKKQWGKSDRSRPYLVLTPTQERCFDLLRRAPSGGLPITAIGKALSLARTSIYLAIRPLVTRGLIARKRFAYSVVDDSLRGIRPVLADPSQQIRDLLEELLNLPRGEVVYSVETDEEIGSLLRAEDGAISWQKRIARRGVVLKGLGSEDALGFFTRNASRDLRASIANRSGSARVVSGKLSGPCVMVVFLSSVIFFSRVRHYFFRIDSPPVATLLKEILEREYVTATSAHLENLAQG